jgi:hypothetical protein
MKRIVLLILFVFPFVKYISAQTFQAGFYIGAAVSDIPGTDNIDNDVDFEHLGFVAAGTVSTRISPRTMLQMEIRYIQRGASQKPVIVNDSASTPYINPTANYISPFFTIDLYYVDVVIGFKHAIHFNLHNVATDKYGIEEGVSLGSLVGYSYEVQAVTYTLDLNQVDISPYVGIYYNVTPHFYAEARYSNSITSALKHDNSANNLGFYNLYYGSWDAGHNVAFTMTIGFNFGGVTNQSANNKPSSPPPSDDN